MKRDYKNYFLGKRYQSAGYRLAFALFIFVLLYYLRRNGFTSSYALGGFWKED